MLRWAGAIVLTATPAFASDTLTGAAKVLDGDTLELQGRLIDLYGLDAPEAEQVCAGRWQPVPLRAECGRRASAADGNDAGVLYAEGRCYAGPTDGRLPRWGDRPLGVDGGAGACARASRRHRGLFGDRRRRVGPAGRPMGRRLRRASQLAAGPPSSGADGRWRALRWWRASTRVACRAGPAPGEIEAGGLRQVEKAPQGKGPDPQQARGRGQVVLDAPQGCARVQAGRFR